MALFPKKSWFDEKVGNPVKKYGLMAGLKKQPIAPEEDVEDQPGRVIKNGVTSIIEDDQKNPMSMGSMQNNSDEDMVGMELPSKHKSSLFDKITQVGLPALYSLGTGNGILPGLISGLSGYQGRNDALNQNSAENYLKNQNAKQESDYKNAMIDISRQNSGTSAANAEETARHHKFVEDNPTSDSSTTADHKNAAEMEAIAKKYTANPTSISKLEAQRLKAYYQKLGGQ